MKTVFIHHGDDKNDKNDKVNKKTGQAKLGTSYQIGIWRVRL